MGMLTWAALDFAVAIDEQLTAEWNSYAQRQVELSLGLERGTLLVPPTTPDRAVGTVSIMVGLLLCFWRLAQCLLRPRRHRLAGRQLVAVDEFERHGRLAGRRWARTMGEHRGHGRSDRPRKW